MVKFIWTTPLETQKKYYAIKVLRTFLLLSPSNAKTRGLSAALPTMLSRVERPQINKIGWILSEREKNLDK
jgi:hypothetical protein